jgi:hypothetical protein
MPTTSTSSTPEELLPGYYLDDIGSWLTLPWPADLNQLPPSLAPQLFRWHRGSGHSDDARSRRAEAPSSSDR